MDFHNYFEIRKSITHNEIELQCKQTCREQSVLCLATRIVYEISDGGNWMSNSLLDGWFCSVKFDPSLLTNYIYQRKAH